MPEAWEEATPIQSEVAMAESTDEPPSSNTPLEKIIHYIILLFTDSHL